MGKRNYTNSTTSRNNILHNVYIGNSSRNSSINHIWRIHYNKEHFRYIGSDISKTALDIKKDKDFSKRIETTKNGNELHQLASTFNQMLDSLESSYNHEKQFSRDVSHELRTPITVILSESEYGVKYADTFEEAKKVMRYVMYTINSKRMRNLINQIMKLSRIEQNHEALKRK